MSLQKLLLFGAVAIPHDMEVNATHPALIHTDTIINKLFGAKNIAVTSEARSRDVGISITEEELDLQSPPPTSVTSPRVPPLPDLIQSCSPISYNSSDDAVDETSSSCHHSRSNRSSDFTLSLTHLRKVRELAEESRKKEKNDTMEERYKDIGEQLRHCSDEFELSCQKFRLERRKRLQKLTAASIGVLSVACVVALIKHSKYYIS